MPSFKHTHSNTSRRLKLLRLVLLAALSTLGSALFAEPAHALFIQVNSARIVGDDIEMVISTDVTHSCFTMKTTGGQTRSLSTICVTGNEQVYTASRSLFPGLLIGDTLVLETVIAPLVTSPSFRFTGDLSLESVRIVGGTFVEVVYSMTFPACAIMLEGPGNNISRTSTAFCDMGEDITLLLDRELHFTNIQPGQSVRLAPITRPDLTTNSVVVGSVPSPLPCVLAAGGGVSLGDRAAVLSSKVYAEGDIYVGSDAAITGDVYGRDDLNMDWRSKITGTVRLIGTLQLERGSIVGSLFENTPVASQLLDDSFVAYSNPNYTVSHDQTLTLPPGRYGTVTVLDRGKLKLSAASAYSFFNLSFANDAKLELNTNQGDFNIEAQTLQVGHRFSMVPGGGSSVDGSRVVFYTNAPSLTIGHDSILRGQLWAPNANLLIQDRAKVQGCVRANSIVVGMDGRILQN